MQTAGVDYLHTCAARHRELLEKLTGKTQDLDAIERAVDSVRSTRALTYDAVKAIIRAVRQIDDLERLKRNLR